MSSIKVLVTCFFFLVSVLEIEVVGLDFMGICVVGRRLLLVLLRTFAPIIAPPIVEAAFDLLGFFGEEVVGNNL